MGREYQSREDTPYPPEVSAEAQMVHSKQPNPWLLLSIYSIAMFVDIWSYSAFFIFTSGIASDLKISFQQQSWIITSYQVTFAAVLLSWGRVVDLFPPRAVFLWGFLILGILNIITSFVVDKFTFFIFRALSGIFGSSLIPASYRLITMAFTKRDLGLALTLFGAAGAVATVTGMLVAGVIELIPGAGQMRAWRWFFRLAGISILSVTVMSLRLIPKAKTQAGNILPLKVKLRRVDILGGLLILVAVATLIISLTFGASYGWTSPAFFVPLVVSAISAPTFFGWEAYQSPQNALLPPSIWKIPNLPILTILGLYTYGYFSVNFEIFVQVYMVDCKMSAIEAAVRLLPEGIASLFICIFLSIFPRFVSQPRTPIVLGLIVAMISLVLWIYSDSRTGKDYWAYVLPGMIIGTIGVDTTFTGINVGVITAAPPEAAGVTSGLLQVAFQAGSSIALAIQAGLMTVHPGETSNWGNVQVGFWFMFGWAAVFGLVFLGLYQPLKTQKRAEGTELPPLVH